MEHTSTLRSGIVRVAALATLLCTLGSSQVSAAPHVRILDDVRAQPGAPPTYAFCETNYSAACYSPQQMRTAYGLNGLIDAGMVGKGETIIIIDSYGSPTIADDLKAFDAGYGLPDPPSLTVLAPLGTVPWDGSNNDQVGWGFEATLDVEWAHAMAPGADIVLLTSPVSETEGVQGMPEFLALLHYALDHHLGKIISQSWGATENTLFLDTAGPGGPQVIAGFEAFYRRAAQEHVTVFASAGDNGSSNVETDGATYYPFPTVGYPASSPFVTAIGGTTLYADAKGKYQSETVWNDPGCCAGGGGISQIFREPGYQYASLPESVQSQLGGMRGLPDVSYQADCYYTFIWVYVSFSGSGGPGWAGICGTSEGSPQWAGIAADLNQFAGRPLGFLNPGIYALGGFHRFGEIGRDITVGNNALLDVPGAVAPGYSATPGWDLASGWGTPNVAGLPFEWIDWLRN